MKISRDYNAPVDRVALALYAGEVPCWRPQKNSDFVPTITPVFPKDRRPGDKRGMVIVVPGGGYGGRAEHERTPFAEMFAAAGMASALLDYRTTAECVPPLGKGPLCDVRRAVRIVRANAEAWGVDPDKIAVMGFSAGGHLTGCAGVHYDAGDPAGADAEEKSSSRPNALVLCYAVLGPNPERGHVGSAANVLGKEPSEEDRDWFELSAHVDENTPPCFIFHTADDPVVPVAGALGFALALRQAKVPFEMHIYPSGPHGVGLAKDRPELSGWTDLLLNWLRGQGYGA